MKLRYRQMHREEIKRQMYRMVDHRWESLLGLMSFSVLMIAFGIRLVISEYWTFGLPLFIFGAIVFYEYLGYRRTPPKCEYSTGWLNRNEQVAVIIGVGLSACLPSTHVELWFIPMPVMLVYANLVLWKRAKPHWRRWYFLAARRYFRKTAVTKGFSAGGASRTQIYRGSRGEKK